MPNLGATELLIIAVVIMVLFGAKRLPDASRSLGRSLRIFKAETKGLHDDRDATLPDRPADRPTDRPAVELPQAEPEPRDQPRP